MRAHTHTHTRAQSIKHEHYILFETNWIYAYNRQAHTYTHIYKRRILQTYTLKQTEYAYHQLSKKQHTHTHTQVFATTYFHGEFMRLYARQWRGENYLQSTHLRTPQMGRKKITSTHLCIPWIWGRQCNFVIRLWWVWMFFLLLQRKGTTTTKLSNLHYHSFQVPNIYCLELYSSSNMQLWHALFLKKTKTNKDANKKIIWIPTWREKLSLSKKLLKSFPAAFSV